MIWTDTHDEKERLDQLQWRRGLYGAAAREWLARALPTGGCSGAHSHGPWCDRWAAVHATYRAGDVRCLSLGEAELYARAANARSERSWQSWLI